MIYDIIIIGMGPAGIGAAIYAKRSGLSILCLEKNMPGGYVNFIDNIENYIGESSISGSDLAIRFYNQVKYNEIAYQTRNVTAIENHPEYKLVITDKDEFKAHHVIVATGQRPKRLNIENEAKLLGKGVSTCALCDGPLYKGQDVVVIGGGNSALSEAIYLSKICRQIYLVHRRSDFKADNIFIEKIKQIPNIELVLNSNVTKIIEENNKVSGVLLDTDRQLAVAGVFIYIGSLPATNFLKDLDILDQDGYITVDEKYESKVAGIYGAGDAIKKEAYQIIPAVNDGIMAAISISKKI